MKQKEETEGCKPRGLFVCSVKKRVPKIRQGHRLLLLSLILFLLNFCRSSLCVTVDVPMYVCTYVCMSRLCKRELRPFPPPPFPSLAFLLCPR